MLLQIDDTLAFLCMDKETVRQHHKIRCKFYFFQCVSFKMNPSVFCHILQQRLKSELFAYRIRQRTLACKKFAFVNIYCRRTAIAVQVDRQTNRQIDRHTSGAFRVLSK